MIYFVTMIVFAINVKIFTIFDNFLFDSASMQTHSDYNVIGKKKREK